MTAQLDCFAALAMPRRLTIDLDALERRYHELSRKIHPDRFASKGPKVRDASLRAHRDAHPQLPHAARPRRPRPLLARTNGEKLAENNKRVPPELAELVFEVQEQLAEMQLSDPEEAHERATQIAARRVQLQFTMDENLAELERHFAKWDQPADQKMLILELKTILSNIAYLRTLIRDVDRALKTRRPPDLKRCRESLA